MLHNNRAQTAETITWIFATIIIIVILLISVFISSVLPGQTKTPTFYPTDLFAQKSLLSYLLTTGSSGQTIYSEINSAGNFSDFNGNLAAAIFKNLYNGYYTHAIFLGVEIGTNSLLGSIQSNKYFPVPPGETPASLTHDLGADYTTQYSIILNNNKALDLILVHEP